MGDKYCLEFAILKLLIINNYWRISSEIIAVKRYLSVFEMCMFCYWKLHNSVYILKYYKIKKVI